MEAGDVEVNPGPTCKACRQAFRAGANPLRCEGGCGALSHRQEKCSLLKRAAQQGAWWCSDCTRGSSREGEEEVEGESGEEASGGGGGGEGDGVGQSGEAQGGSRGGRGGGREERTSCYACQALFRRGADPLVCVGCGALCHRQTRCSGVSRAALSGAWSCRVCAGVGGAVAGVETLAGRALDDIGAPKPKSCAVICFLCSKPAGRSKIPFTCSVCKRECHKKCSGLSRKEQEVFIAAMAWKCPDCVPKAKPKPKPSSASTQPAEPKAAFVLRGVLRILQWNADGIQTKMPELESRVKEYEFDVIMIQESKLQAKHKTPQLRGYTTIRRDRGCRPGCPEGKGGGLLTFVKEDIPYTVVELAEIPDDSLLERLSIQLRAGTEGAIRVVNVYCPPTRGAQPGGEFNPNELPASRKDVICGDLNAHSVLWDREQPEDERGGMVEDWLMAQDFGVANDGAATRVNRGTGGESSPDVTLVHQSQLNKVEWTCLECMGSDHYPIMVELECGLTAVKAADPGLRWKWAKANWEGYRAEVEEKVEAVRGEVESWSVGKQSDFLVDSMLSAAKVHVGQAKATSAGKAWMTEEIRHAVKRRNLLRTTVAANREEWIGACREVQEMVRASKEERWKDFLEDAVDGANPNKMWETVKKLSGTVGGSTKNEVLRHNGREYASPVAKADAFMRQYAAVSRLKLDRTERMRKKLVQRRLAADSADPESCQPFSMEELSTALKEMKEKAAAGPDEIPPRFLKELGPLAASLLLAVFNQSWEHGFCPQSWRDAEIVPLLKKGKPASNPESYRPVSLTSCVAKTIERMIASRLSFLAEENGWWCEDQAGFRKLRSCEDQVLRISQTISDGFQEKPPKRGVIVLLDYSKAYDTVWREELLLGMLGKGVPERMVRWCMGFLRNRQARVRMDGRKGHVWKMRQGLPQGAVLSPLLFLFYIDAVRKVVPEGVNVSMYADDLALYALHHDKVQAQALVQAAVDAVEKWSKGVKLKLNAAKCEVSFFSNDTGEAGWVPSIALQGTTLAFNKTPVFLGIVFDRTLSFGPQVDAVRKKVGGKCNLLAVVASREWGWKKEYLKRVFQATVGSVLNYCGAAWQPWLAASNVDKLDACQNRALRLVTGQLRTTPLEALRAEADVPSMRTKIRMNAANAWEKTLRLPASNPRSRLATDAPHRLKTKGSWRKLAREEEKVTGLGDLPRLPIPPQTPPWGTREVRRWSTRTDMAPVGSRGERSRLQLREIAIEAIRLQGPFEWIIYTDGTPGGDNHDSGAAAVVTRGPPDKPVREEVRRRRGRAFASSYEAEVEGLKLAVNWVRESGPHQVGRVMICTDCRVITAGLASPSTEDDVETAELRELLDELRTSVVIQWVPGHVGLQGNEWADKEAREATTGRRERDEEEGEEEAVASPLPTQDTHSSLLIRL